MLEKPRLRFKTGLNARLVLTWMLFLPAFCLLASSALADSNVVVRVMAANLNGDSQTLGTPQLDILKGLKADVVAMQEFQYSDNSPAAFRSMIDDTFGTNYVYFRESGYSLPNGIISRYPIVASGSWNDPYVSNRGFAWAHINLPGTNDLYVVSVHLLTTSSTTRNSEAAEIKTRIQSEFPSDAWVIVAGDMNTDSRGEAAITTFTSFLSDSPIPTDAESGGDPDTNLPRSKPYDYVLPSFSMTNALTPVVFPSHTYSKGLVFDSRVYTPLSEVSPVQFSDSTSCQHMGILKDFLVPTLEAGALLAVSPASDFSSSGQTGGPFSPSSRIYTVSNTGDSNLTWAATYAAAWVAVVPTNGTLTPGTSTNVTVSINTNANSLAVSSYSDTVLFTNITNAAGTTTRSVNLTVSATFPIIVTNGWMLSAGNCSNGVVDPGETVMVSLFVKNIGSANTSNLVATLLATSDVISPDGPYTYGVVSTDGTPVAQAFTFTAGGTCGSNITATLQLQDGAVNLGTVSYTIPLGVTTGIFTQNFDSVTAPALPAAWSTSATGAQSNWITSTTTADTAPNAAYSPDPGNVGVNELDSPSIGINSSMARLTFRHNYSLTASSVNSATGYSGGVLEIAIGGGSYTDIVAAGGSFVSGGYNRTLSSAYSNPLAGRPAWSGVSGSFTTTVVNLPAAAAGQNIQLRLRCASGTNPPPVTSSGTLAYWNFDASNGTPTTVAANISATSVTSTNVAGVAPTFPLGNPGSAISSVNFVTSAGPPTTNFSCWSFALTPANGAQAILSSLSFEDRASGTGPTKFSVHISTNSDFSSTIYDSGIQNTHVSSTVVFGTNTLALSNSNLTGTIYFRIYGYQSGALTGTWRIDNVNIQGTVTSGGTVGGSGWYVDTVSIQDAFCCTSFEYLPVADFTASNATGCPPVLVTFTDTSTGSPTSWLWDFDNNGSTDSTLQYPPAQSYSTPGTYTVKLSAINAGGTNTITKSVVKVFTPIECFENKYGVPADVSDSDGDGMSNTNEFLAGFNPTNSAARLRIITITKTDGTNVTINYLGASGDSNGSPGPKTNVLDSTLGTPPGYTNNFVSTGLTNVLTGGTGLGTQATFVHTNGATGPAQYYRVRVLVP